MNLIDVPLHTEINEDKLYNILNKKYNLKYMEGPYVNGVYSLVFDITENNKYPRIQDIQKIVNKCTKGD